MTYEEKYVEYWEYIKQAEESSNNKDYYKEKTEQIIDGKEYFKLYEILREYDMVIKERIGRDKKSIEFRDRPFWII